MLHKTFHHLLAVWLAAAAAGCEPPIPKRPPGATCVRYQFLTSRVHLGGDRWSEPEVVGYVAYGDLLFNDQVKGGKYAACPDQRIEARDVGDSLLADLAQRVPKPAHRDGPKLVALIKTGRPKTRARRNGTIQLQGYEAYLAGCPFVRLDGKHGHLCVSVP
jgi:hypothetical protein